MDVYVIRHAAAVGDSLALPDPARYLSPTGRGQARALGERLRWHDCAPAQVWTSPLVRAVQTAELVVAGLQLAATDVIAVPALGPAGDVRAIAAALAALATDAAVVVVGHEPELSALGGLLVGRDDFSPLARAEAVRISAGRIRWRFAHDDAAPRS